MPARRSSTRCALGCTFAAALSLSATADSNVQPLNNAGPVFGLAADVSSCCCRRRRRHSPAANLKTEWPLPCGEFRVAPVNPFTQLAITGGAPNPTAAKLYRR